MLPPCLGRRELLAQTRSALTARRWVTLVGVPGVGKTLLARHTASSMGLGAWIDVHPLMTVDEVLSECIYALDPDTAPGDTDVLALKRALDDDDRILVLDGVDLEGLEGLGELIESIVQSTTQARILCTGTRSVGMSSEVAITVEALPLPPRNGPLVGAAVELFVSRVAAAGGQVLDLVTDADAVRTLLEASGGIPLHLEQLAAQAALVGVSAVVPTDSLSTAVAESYRMVDPQSQLTYRRLAAMDVPVGLDVLGEIVGVDRATASALAARLARHSLVEIHADGRVGMLPPVRRHALELARANGDDDEAIAGIIRWADAALPRDNETGAADAAWLGDIDTLYNAVIAACRNPATRDTGYRLANRAFGSLYTAMQPREALELLEVALASGDGPPDVGSQAARRAGICASEVRGTFAGLPFLDRAEQHADLGDHPQRHHARTASIRAEIYLDAGQLDRAYEEATRCLTIAGDDSYSIRQARRTLMDVEVSRGRLTDAEALATPIIDGAVGEEYWLAIAARILEAKIAWEQGRTLEAAALARAARDEASSLAEDRLALLADVLLRQVAGTPATIAPEISSLPWSVRLGVQLQAARDVLVSNAPKRAAGLVADVVVLADSSRLERDGVEARIVLGDALLADGDAGQALSTYAAAVRRGLACPMPLRVADALDGMALVLSAKSKEDSIACASAAYAMRISRGAARAPRAGVEFDGLVIRRRSEWVRDGMLTREAVAATARMEAGEPSGAGGPNLAASLTRAQLAVAELVGKGMTSKQIAEQLYLSPRTVDNHLAQIYRRLDIPSRARLAALVGRAS